VAKPKRAQVTESLAQQYIEKHNWVRLALDTLGALISDIPWIARYTLLLVAVILGACCFIVYRLT